MILSQTEIRKEVEKGDIKFDPVLEKHQWGEASVDLRLGFKFTKLTPAPGVTLSMAKGIGAVSDSGLWVEKTLKSRNEFDQAETFKLAPGEFILAQTY